MKPVVFAAVIGFTEKETHDSRMLAEPEGGLVHRPYPLPVFGYPVNLDPVEGGPRERAGVIEMVTLCDRKLIAFGRMFPDVCASRYIEALASGEAWLEIDTDEMVPEFVWPDGAAESAHPLIRFTRWRLSCAVIGQDPAWVLPPVQIEEIRNV